MSLDFNSPEFEVIRDEKKMYSVSGVRASMFQ